MTTGRINQVTIVRTSLDTRSAEARARRPSSCSVGATKRPALSDGYPKVTYTQGHPIAPTKFPRGWSATETPDLPHGSDELRHAPPKRRIPYVNHVPKDGYRPGLAPKCLNRLIAIGQPSTDSDDAGYIKQPGFGHPPCGC